jgi:hypothetical protein
MDMPIEVKTIGLWGRLKAFVVGWGINSSAKHTTVEMESWLEHRMERLWEVEENQVLLHYEKLSQEG